GERRAPPPRALLPRRGSARHLGASLRPARGRGGGRRTRAPALRRALRADRPRHRPLQRRALVALDAPSGRISAREGKLSGYNTAPDQSAVAGRWTSTPP